MLKYTTLLFQVKGGWTMTRITLKKEQRTNLPLMHQILAK